jgi:TrmH family RNA methyltransferase
VNEITSAQNPKFKSWSALIEARGIKKAQRAIVSGRKLVNEFLKQNPSGAEDLLCPPKSEEVTIPKHVKSYRLASPIFKQLDVMGTKAPLLVVKLSQLETWSPRAPQGLELIVALSDPGNLGALLRSAEAFGVSRVILTEESCSPFLPKAIRAGSGANFRIPLATAGPLAELNVPNAYCLDMNGQDLGQFAWPKNLYLILGEEGRGVPQSLKAQALSIPMAGQVESLNAMAAASIALFSYRIRR